jgi:signal transduction histidine kinase
MTQDTERYRLKLFSDLLVQAGGLDKPAPLLACIAEHLARVMPIDHAWLVVLEGNCYATYAYPASETPAMMGKETIAFLAADEFRASIPNLSEYRAARGADFFPPDIESLVSIAARFPGNRHADCDDGYLVIASRKPSAYSAADVDFLFTLMLALRPLVRVMSLRERGADTAAMRRTLTDMLIHDLRAPLGIIQWNMEQLADGFASKSSAEQEGFIRSSIESTQELLEMADSLLDIDRLETGTLDLNPQDCRLAELAAAIARRMDFVTAQMGLRFSFNFAEGYPAIRADRQLMRRVLFNLIFNAAKYAPAASTIHIEGGYDQKRVWLAVRDEGQGVPEEYLESIFDKYAQAAPRDHGAIHGKGLGLTFCRLAVTLHGGTIRAENSPGGGARFVVELSRE